ncbi:MAG: type II toxin-antitoxin system mRNA interferase toxin, RelE/StbE family [Gammaproteobacteria bacterium]
MNDDLLVEALRDHPLIGKWKDYREGHLKPDHLLIYPKRGNGVLELVRLGSHSELFR